MIGYAPFGHGNFPSPESEGGRILVEIAKQHQKTPHQIVLNFITSYTKLFTIPKTSRPERVRENSGSVGWCLTENDIVSINQAFPVPDHDVPLEMI